uniref:Uncharacterized protein n=1 Tax=Chromera velia CCMP2878 TaxID=1169474 RepID=A0A0G4I2Z2_9ALVE|eukprot:Cvel_10462.t1-p1 / transcript=Cvel_10462.t1 / gene=Cvel_10462 / organism=Chromera_velia_CCMP2878 / gene_product=hypothetical protein / transcript_product=hypothetical protein / location=Cvel_scaffold630:47435-56142(+) / protein_length=671 / sequence_SO=supercontig / SO=protein_coding / is_pseudo=false
MAVQLEQSFCHFEEALTRLEGYRSALSRSAWKAGLAKAGKEGETAGLLLEMQAYRDAQSVAASDRLEKEQRDAASLQGLVQLCDPQLSEGGGGGMTLMEAAGEEGDGRIRRGSAGSSSVQPLSQAEGESTEEKAASLSLASRGFADGVLAFLHERDSKKMGGVGVRRGGEGEGESGDGKEGRELEALWKAKEDALHKTGWDLRGEASILAGALREAKAGAERERRALRTRLGRSVAMAREALAGLSEEDPLGAGGGGGGGGAAVAQAFEDSLRLIRGQKAKRGYLPSAPEDALDRAVAGLLNSTPSRILLPCKRLGPGDYLFDKRVKLSFDAFGDVVVLSHGNSTVPLSVSPSSATALDGAGQSSFSSCPQGSSPSSPGVSSSGVCRQSLRSYLARLVKDAEARSLYLARAEKEREKTGGAIPSKTKTGTGVGTSVDSPLFSPSLPSRWGDSTNHPPASNAFSQTNSPSFPPPVVEWELKAAASSLPDALQTAYANLVKPSPPHPTRTAPKSRRESLSPSSSAQRKKGEASTAPKNGSAGPPKPPQMATPSPGPHRLSIQSQPVSTGGVSKGPLPLDDEDPVLAGVLQDGRDSRGGKGSAISGVVKRGERAVGIPAQSHEKPLPIPHGERPGSEGGGHLNIQKGSTGSHAVSGKPVASPFRAAFRKNRGAS